MKKYLIVKRVFDSSEKFILCPLVVDDEIYEFDSFNECNEKIEELKVQEKYKNIFFEVIEVDY